MTLLQKLLIPFALFAVAMPAIAQTPPAQDANTMTAEAKKEVLDGLSNVVKNYAFVPGVDFSKWDDYLKSRQEALDAAKNEEEFAEAIDEGIAKYFGASHLVLITPKMAAARKDRSTVGVGIRVEPLEEGLRVLYVFPNTPAETAGLQVGDVILEADGKKLEKGMTFQGPEGTSVKLKVQRGEKMLDFTVDRKKYSTDVADTLTWVNDQTAVLKVNTFMDGYNTSRIEKLMGEAQKAKKLILDLRGNAGGIVLNMYNLLGYFLDSNDAFGYYVTKLMVDKYQKETSSDVMDLKKIVDWNKPSGMKPRASAIGTYSGNLAVLVDGGSGSAAEITALALKEFRNAPVVGTKSAGAVLVSTMTELSHGWQVQFPFMDYISAKGVRLEGTGITPDSEAPTPKFGESDKAVELAIAALDKKPNASSGGRIGK